METYGRSKKGSVTCCIRDEQGSVVLAEVVGHATGRVDGSNGVPGGADEEDLGPADTQIKRRSVEKGAVDQRSLDGEGLKGMSE